jgi:hypothetical protein
MRERVRLAGFLLIAVCVAAGVGLSAQAPSDPVSGEWAGEVSIGGQVVGFSMTLKLAGETVTGEIGSAAGKSPIANGSWKDGTLVISFTYSDGASIGMSGKVENGKLNGVVDYGGGQMTGTWSATKK